MFTGNIQKQVSVSSLSSHREPLVVVYMYMYICMYMYVHSK